jgi:hypothetical protein
MLFSAILIMVTITLTNSFSIKKTPEYVHKFMIFNKKPSFIMKQETKKCNELCKMSPLFSKKTCKCKNYVVKKDEDIFDKFERVSRQGNRVMQEEYLKEIINNVKKNKDSNNI